MWPLIAPSVSVGWSAPMWGSLLGHLWSGWVQELKNVRRNYKEEILKQTFITQWKFDCLLFIIFNTNVNSRPMLFHISGQGGLFMILSISLSSMKSLRSPWVISCHGRSSFPIFLSKSLLVGAKLLQKSRITRTYESCFTQHSDRVKKLSRLASQNERLASDHGMRGQLVVFVGDKNIKTKKSHCLKKGLQTLIWRFISILRIIRWAVCVGMQ